MATARSASPPPDSCRCSDEPIVALGSDLGPRGRQRAGRLGARRRRRVAPAGLARRGRAAAPIGCRARSHPELLNLGGTLATEAGTLREALDAALSSPSGRGVVVHEDGRFAGTVTASEVLSPDRGAGRAARQDAERSAAENLNATRATGAHATGAHATGVDAMNDIWQYFRDHQHEIARLDVDDGLAGRRLPLVVGLVVALPLGWLASRYRWTYPPIVTIAGLLYTIPSLVLFVTLPGLLGTKVLDADQRRRGAHRSTPSRCWSGSSPTGCPRCRPTPWRPRPRWATPAGSACSACSSRSRCR